MTTRGGELLATICCALAAAGSEADSCRGVPLRAESAAKGETGFGRGAAPPAVEVGPADEETDEDTIEGRGAGFAMFAAADMFWEAAASLSSCSIGSNRWACAILSRPSSR